MVTEDFSERKNDWQAILYRMREKNVSPSKLSQKTYYPEQLIEKGIKGEPVEIELSFLRNCVKILVFEPTESRITGQTHKHDKFLENLSYSDCIKLIKPSPAMPPLTLNPWDRDKSD
jgi:hypothetical protein